ncbi:MAG: dUTP diphosphatase [Desulfobacterales bacterium]|nr:dUTP diphosphatase [Desulfobacterales bacterium]MBF0395833.1 dUTP diphosphatase [Desulfobacterales bacterium]
MIEPIIEIVRLQKDIPLPSYMTTHSSGMDIFAANNEPLILEPFDICLIPTGFSIAIPDGFEAQIRPRSGIAIKHGITIINSPGTIDADYRGEVKIGLINLGKKPYTVNRGDRIAQMIISKTYHGEFNVVENLSKTERDIGGFGHTGI